jgi:3-hydroxybutyryl-CoA dehydrogenase
MNPVPIKSTVELVQGDKTEASVVERVCEFLITLGKRAILVKDGPGFVINRIFMVTINEAIAVLESGRAPAADIDRLFEHCLSHKMGPLASADLIGLDTILFSLRVLREELGDTRFDPAPLLIKMVDEGRLGIKSGSGFFDYGER